MQVGNKFLLVDVVALTSKQGNRSLRCRTCIKRCVENIVLRRYRLTTLVYCNFNCIYRTIVGAGYANQNIREFFTVTKQMHDFKLKWLFNVRCSSCVYFDCSRFFMTDDWYPLETEENIDFKLANRARGGERGAKKRTENSITWKINLRVVELSMLRGNIASHGGEILFFQLMIYRHRAFTGQRFMK